MQRTQDDIDKIIAHSDKPYHYLKLLEELAELQEVIVKRLTKSEKHRPPIAKIIEEAGDVLVRINVISVIEDITEEVFERYDQKVLQISKEIDSRPETINTINGR
jgi:hypothetical protein